MIDKDYVSIQKYRINETMPVSVRLKKSVRDDLRYLKQEKGYSISGWLAEIITNAVNRAKQEEDGDNADSTD